MKYATAILILALTLIASDGLTYTPTRVDSRKVNIKLVVNTSMPLDMIGSTKWWDHNGPLSLSVIKVVASEAK
jgi:hypothetical protein